MKPGATAPFLASTCAWRRWRHKSHQHAVTHHICPENTPYSLQLPNMIEARNGILVACVFAARTESTPGAFGLRQATPDPNKEAQIVRNPPHRRAGNAKQRSTCLSVETVIHLNMWRTRASPAHIAAFSPAYGAKAFEETVGADPRRLAWPARGRADAQANPLRIRATPRRRCPLARRALLPHPCATFGDPPPKFCLYVQVRGHSSGLWVGERGTKRTSLIATFPLGRFQRSVSDEYG